MTQTCTIRSPADEVYGTNSLSVLDKEANNDNAIWKHLLVAKKVLTGGYLLWIIFAVFHFKINRHDKDLCTNGKRWNGPRVRWHKLCITPKLISNFHKLIDTNGVVTLFQRNNYVILLCCRLGWEGFPTGTGIYSYTWIVILLSSITMTS